MCEWRREWVKKEKESRLKCEREMFPSSWWSSTFLPPQQHHHRPFDVVEMMMMSPPDEEREEKARRMRRMRGTFYVEGKRKGKDEEKILKIKGEDREMREMMRERKREKGKEEGEDDEGKRGNEKYERKSDFIVGILHSDTCVCGGCA